MATRRIVASEKTILEKDDVVGSSPAAGDKSNITPAVPMDVILKLLGFTFAMIVLPIGTYFVTVDFLFKGRLREYTNPPPSARNHAGRD